MFNFKLKRHFIISLAILILVFTLFAAGCGNDTPGKGTIAIAKTPYANDWIPVHIIEQVAQELGYETKLVEGDVGFMFLGLSQGDIDIYSAIWLPTLHKNYADKYKNEIELTGTVYENAAMGIAIPSYVDVHSIDELKGRGNEFGNRIVGIEPSAGLMLTAAEVLELYGLDEEYELLEGSTPAMLGEVEQAVKNSQPVLFLAWRPHPMFIKYDIRLLEDPEGCWIFDNNMTGVATDLKDRAPDMYEFTKNFKISIPEIEAILSTIDETGQDVEELTKEWIEQNRDKVDQMIGK